MQVLPVRLAVALVAALLAGFVLHGAAGSLIGEPAGDGAGHPATVAERVIDTAAPPAVTGRTWTSSWPWATTRAVAVAVAFGLVVAAAALLAAAARTLRPVVAWRLLRPDRTLATARHCSPLAARRAPPAPAGC